MLDAAGFEEPGDILSRVGKHVQVGGCIGSGRARKQGPDEPRFKLHHFVHDLERETAPAAQGLEVVFFFVDAAVFDERRFDLDVARQRAVLVVGGSPGMTGAPLLAGEISSCYSMTEPHAGADPTLFTTQAVKDGDEFRVRDADEQAGYPSVILRDDAVQVSAKLGDIAPGDVRNVFRSPLRLCVGSALAGRRIGINYTLFAQNLRTPATGKLRLFFDATRSAGSARKSA